MSLEFNAQRTGARAPSCSVSLTSRRTDVASQRLSLVDPRADVFSVRCGDLVTQAWALGVKADMPLVVTRGATSFNVEDGRVKIYGPDASCVLL